MWTMRFYSPNDDELRHEVELPDMRLDDAAELLGYPPTQLGSTPLSDDEVLKLAEAFGLAVPKGLEAFLDYDEEESQAAPLEKVSEAAALALATHGPRE